MLPVKLLLLFVYLLAPLASSGQTLKLVKRDGVWVEQFDSTQTDKNRFAANNYLFKPGYRYLYRYVYIDSAGNPFLQRILPDGAYYRDDRWKLVPLARKDSLTNDLISLTVEEGLEGLSPQHAAYHQTPILYEYLSPAGKLYFTARRGVVENKKNIWMEPPQERLFQLLLLNPFPSIQAPFVAGHQWHWEIQLGEQWSNPRWANWKGRLRLHHRYNNLGRETIETSLGSLSCWVIEARGHSLLGTTGLTAYLHPEWGFVRLHYRNINGSQIRLELLRRENVATKVLPSLK